MHAEYTFPTQLERFIQFGTIVLGSVATYLFGDVTELLFSVVILMVIDLLTGLAVGADRKELSSQRGAAGVKRKGMMLAVIVVCHLVDVQFLGGSNAFATVATLYVFATEALSILENATTLGVSIPPQLRELLQKVRDESHQP